MHKHALKHGIKNAPTHKHECHILFRPDHLCLSLRLFSKHMKRSVQGKRAKRKAAALAKSSCSVHRERQLTFAKGSCSVQSERQLLCAKRKAAAPCKARGSCSGEEKRAKRKAAAPAPCPDRCFQAFFLNMLRNQEFSSAHWSRRRELRRTEAPRCPRLLALFPVCPVANALPSRGRRRKTRSAAQAAAPAKCKRQRCPRLISLRRVPVRCAPKAEAWLPRSVKPLPRSVCKPCPSLTLRQLEAVSVCGISRGENFSDLPGPPQNAANICYHWPLMAAFDDCGSLCTPVFGAW